MPESSNLGPRWRHLARVVRGEKATAAGARKALAELLAYVGAALRAGGYDTAALDAKTAKWRASVDRNILPPVETVFTGSFAAAARGTIDPGPYAVRHLEAVWNRLSGVPDEVFDTMRLELVAGREAGESIPQLAARVDGLLADDQRWTNRATLIARTESIGAANAGGYGAAHATAQVLGEDPAMVVKTWLSAQDSRTREAHAEADGQQVMGLDSPFTVDGEDMQFPGDPAGSAANCANCRCTQTVSFPGDADYPTELSAGRGPATVSDNPANDIPANVTPPAAAPIPVAAQTPAEVPVDPGPLDNMERMARALTPEELLREAKRTRGSTRARTVARAELKRRGLAAAANQEDTAMAEDNENHDGAVIVALPAQSEPVYDIGDPEQHATLLYLGDAVDIATPLADVASAVQAIADGQTVFTEAVTGVESLGDDGARVWMLEGTTLSALHALLRDDPVLRPLYDAVEQFPDFTAHETISYPAPDGDGLLDPETEAAAAGVESITYDRLAVWWGESRTVYDLPSTDPQEAPVDTETPDYAAPVPGEAPAGGPAMADDIATDGPPLYGILWPEATLSGDGRLIDADATVWRDLPLPLMAQEATAMGHDGAVRVARIDTITRDADTYNVPVIRYTGVWDTSAAAVEAMRQVDNKMLRGVSVDGDDVTVELRASDGSPLDPMVDDYPEDGVVIEAATAARVAGATACSIPAFQQAYVANGTYEPGTPEPGWTADGDPIPTGAVPDAEPVEPVEPNDDPSTRTTSANASGSRDSHGTGSPAYSGISATSVGSAESGSNSSQEPGPNETPTSTTTTTPGNSAGSSVRPAIAASGRSRMTPNSSNGQSSTSEDPSPTMAPAWTLVSRGSLVAGANGQIPAWYFQNPNLTEPTRLTVTDDGHVFGTLAAWGVCHIGIDGICQEPPVSMANYAYFATGCAETDEGLLPVGQLTMSTGHAAMGLRARPAAEHYDNTGAAVADVSMGQDGHGIWFAGRLRPGTTPEQIYAMKAAGSVSGDWREIGGNLELVAALVVNVPGFPIPAAAVAASGRRATALVASGVVRPVNGAQIGVQPTLADVTRSVVATLDRRERATVAAARIRTARAATVRRRVMAQAQAQTNNRKTRVAAAVARIGGE